MSRLRIPALALLLVVVACGSTDDVAPSSVATTSPVTTSPVTTTPTLTAPPTTSAIGEPGSDPAPTIDPDSVAAPPDVVTEPGGVVRIIDGDSMEIDIDGVVTEVRMIGINAPERDECHGAASRATLEAIVDSADSSVELAADNERFDQFGRALRYLSAEGVDINALLIATGNAIAIQTGHARQSRYLDLMEMAFADGLGIWGLGACGEMTVDDGDVVIADIAFDPTGRDDEHLNDEWVVVRNNSPSEIDVSGWVVRDESTANRYVFPDGATVSADAVVKVRVGCGNDTLTERFWCSDGPVWSNGGDTVMLLDRSGNVIDLLIYSG